MVSPLAAYRARLAAGDLKLDAAQADAAERLDELAKALAHYRKTTSGGFLGFGRKSAPPPKGLYVWGPVGRGKSMLMDLFFETAPIKAKRRVHFHAFMQETHAAIRSMRTAEPGDPIPKIARRIADATQLLCFDEFQVSDIADAMLLGRLFETLFAENVIVVATSNRPPDDLYKDGINRQLFLPFIAEMKERLNIYRLAGPTDFRLDRIKGLPVFLTPVDAAATAALDEAWAHLTDDAPGAPLEIKLMGRILSLPRFAHGVARARFAELCGAALGPPDFLAIAEHAETLILDAIPILTPARRNEAKRFVTLIDALYEARRRFICSAEAPPDALYRTGDGSFEFERTASRLVEMQSADWPYRLEEPVREGAPA